jgi:UDP-2,3-diacylglucosamine pyrophosphatase LpxH
VSGVADDVIYFVSDTHLGDGTGADLFHYPQQLLTLFRRIEAERAQLVLLGDFLELWASGLDAVLMRQVPILTAVGRLASLVPVTYLVGNHDCLPWYAFLGASMGNFKVAEVFTAVRGNLVAIHGHQYDRLNQVKQAADGAIKLPFTRRLVEMVGFLGRLGGEGVGEWLARLSNHLEFAAQDIDEHLKDWDDQSRRALKMGLTHTRAVLERESPGERGYPPGERQYEEGALQWMRKGATLVVMGHTHHPMVARYGRKLYVNSGSWVSALYPPTYVRYAQGRLELLNGVTHEPYLPTP